jgi:CRISPR/Cas system-associated endonuclease/helicase Cas3
MPLTTGHHGRPPSSVTELKNFRQQDKEAARDFLARIKSLFPLVEIPEFWDDDEGIALFKHLSWLISAVIVLADWVGSSTQHFPESLSQYVSMNIGNSMRWLKRNSRFLFSSFVYRCPFFRNNEVISLYSTANAFTAKSA